MSVSLLLNRQLPQMIESPALSVVRTFMSSLPAAEPSVAPDDDFARLDRRANLHGTHLLGAGNGYSPQMIWPPLIVVRTFMAFTSSAPETVSLPR
jgi:hypothetical protein